MIDAMSHDEMIEATSMIANVVEIAVRKKRKYARLQRMYASGEHDAKIAEHEASMMAQMMKTLVASVEYDAMPTLAEVVAAEKGAESASTEVRDGDW